jgi:hypothetical protein
MWTKESSFLFYEKSFVLEEGNELQIDELQWVFFFFFEICEVSCLATNYQCLYVKVVPWGRGRQVDLVGHTNDYLHFCMFITWWQIFECSMFKWLDIFVIFKFDQLLDFE